MIALIFNQKHEVQEEYTNRKAIFFPEIFPTTIDTAALAGLPSRLATAERISLLTPTIVAGVKRLVVSCVCLCVSFLSAR